MSSNNLPSIISMFGVCICIILLFAARHHKPSRKKIQQIWHGKIFRKKSSTTISSSSSTNTQSSPSTNTPKSSSTNTPTYLFNESITKSSCNKNLKVTLFLTTYNRIGYVHTFSKWLKTDPGYSSKNVDLVIRDDASSEHDEKYLRKLFPEATILIEKTHHRADKNIRLNFEWFDKKNSDILVSIDSDSILLPTWYDFICHNMPKSGFATLYHSGAKHHRTKHCNDGVWCHQKSTGSLGMVLSKNIIHKMLQNNQNSAFDWGIVDWLNNENIPIRAPKKSYVLHYGYFGQNNSPSNMLELAEGFDMESIDLSVLPCIRWWMQANSPKKICPFDNSELDIPTQQHCIKKPYGVMWDVFKSMVDILNNLKANYTISSGTVLSWYRDCSLGSSDIDMNIELRWFTLYQQKLHQSLIASGWRQEHKFGTIGDVGYEEAWLKNGIKTDLFSIAHIDGHYVNSLTISGIQYPCYSLFERYEIYRWNALTFQVPSPIEPYLVGKYGNWKKKHIYGYAWDIEPFKTDDGRYHCIRNSDEMNRLKLKYKNKDDVYQMVASQKTLEDVNNNMNKKISNYENTFYLIWENMENNPDLQNKNYENILRNSYNSLKLFHYKVKFMSNSLKWGTKYDIYQMAIDSPLDESIFDRVYSGKHPMVHLSDISRFLFLYHYGGSYLDADSIMQNNRYIQLAIDENKMLLMRSPNNHINCNIMYWGAIQYNGERFYISNGLLHNFRPKSKLVNNMLMEMNKRYDPSTWSSIGPHLITFVWNNLNFKEKSQFKLVEWKYIYVNDKNSCPTCDFYSEDFQNKKK